MPAKLEMRLRLDRDELAEALKTVPIEDVGFVFFRVGRYYAGDAPPNSPKANFGTALGEIIRKNLELGYSF